MRRSVSYVLSAISKLRFWCAMASIGRVRTPYGQTFSQWPSQLKHISGLPPGSSMYFCMADPNICSIPTERPAIAANHRLVSHFTTNTIAPQHIIMNTQPFIESMDYSLSNFQKLMLVDD